ncbi:GvpL/GvpF family gas vesicle protein [Leptolyngbya iicbica]|nr:GvpL/GvpF family gas vesicle protein [Leptolyngbya sp. LK]
MIYLYALCPNSTETNNLPEGIGTAQVEVLTVGTLGAVIERDVDIAQIQKDDAQLMAAVLAHDRILSHLFTYSPLLPLRFGTQFSNSEAVTTFLKTQGETYRQKLSHLQDRAEYLVKLIPQPLDLPAIASDLKGREYFLAKKQRLQDHTAALNQQADELQTFLTDLATQDIPLVRSAPQDHEERLHVLLSRDTDTTEQVIMTWQEQLPNWQVVCSEPLPPYHFAA